MIAERVIVKKLIPGKFHPVCPSYNINGKQGRFGQLQIFCFLNSISDTEF